MAEQYDVIVIGAHTAGVIAAALLAKRGRRVMLVDHGENTHTYMRRGRYLPLAPTLLPSLDHSPPVQEVHQMLGMTHDVRAATAALQPAFQAVMPNHRIDVTSDYHSFLDELEREFPESVGQVRSFLDRLFTLDAQLSAFLSQQPILPPASWRDHWRNGLARRAMVHLDRPFEEHALLEGIPPDHPVRELLLGPLWFFGHLWTDTPSTFHAVRLIARYFRGAVTFANDAENLHALLLRTAELSGVTVRRHTRVAALRAQGNRLHHMLVQGDDTEYRSMFFVANTVGSLDDLLHVDAPLRGWPWQRHGKRLSLGSRKAVLQRVGGLFTVNMVIDQDAIPCGMGQALFLLNGRRVKRDHAAIDPPLFMRRYPVRKRDQRLPVHVSAAGAMPPDTKEVLSIACPVRLADVEHNADACDALKQQIIARVGRVMPFVGDYVVDVSVPSDLEEWQQATGETSPAVDPWQVYPFYEASRTLGMGIVASTMRTRFCNVIHAGDDVIPGLGIEGDYMAGLATVRMLEHRAGRTWRHIAMPG